MSEATSPFAPRPSKITYKPTIETFLALLEDHFEGVIRFNVLTGAPQIFRHGKWQRWEDADDSMVRLYFQNHYDLYHKNHLDDAMRVFLRQHQVNPLTDLIDSLQWDGVPRIEEALHHITGCDDTPYTREVSRLFFAGGIHRAYRPGCKFDDAPVLIGKQGGGKSALVRLLAMDDDYFREVKTFDGAEGVEALTGGWIIEIPEMLAAARAQEVELVKAYITRQEDTYRRPYDRYVQTLPRRCVFVGTTNGALPGDPTGNRRFYPVYVKHSGYQLFDRIDELKPYVQQCWAEAKALFDQGELKSYASFDLLADIREEQELASEDDPRKGLIMAYCDRKAVGELVCVLELWTEALRQDASMRMPTPKDRREIAQIVSSLPGWERTGKNVRFVYYGVQKSYKKAFEAVERPPDCPF